MIQSGHPRPAVLNGRQVSELYAAVSFLMRHYGIVMNAHLTFVWGEMGVLDHAAAAKVLTRFNHEAEKWLRVGCVPGDMPKRFTKRGMVESSGHFYIYVHENGREKGFHTHELAFIPRAKVAAFEEWARGCLARLTGQSSVTPASLVITYDRSRTESSQVERCWSWFRYLTKRLHPGQSIRIDGGGLVSCREIFKPSHPFIETAPVHCAQIASGSHNIWTKAQAKAGFRSRFLRDDQLDRLYDGAELVERRRAIADAENAAWQATALRTLDL